MRRFHSKPRQAAEKTTTACSLASGCAELRLLASTQIVAAPRRFDIGRLLHSGSGKCKSPFVEITGWHKPSMVESSSQVGCFPDPHYAHHQHQSQHASRGNIWPVNLFTPEQKRSSAEGDGECARP
mmetsp:Transcript_48825/g.105210  ORF Transcript_48825/g.105210 Transcript_48825/m.105210 type:complete len:126 (+) Transcript_48825:273-650(+)